MLEQCFEVHKVFYKYSMAFYHYNGMIIIVLLFITAFAIIFH